MSTDHPDSTWKAVLAFYGDLATHPNSAHMGSFRRFVTEMMTAGVVDGVLASQSHETLVISTVGYPERYDRTMVTLLPHPDGRIEVSYVEGRHVERQMLSSDRALRVVAGFVKRLREDV